MVVIIVIGLCFVAAGLIAALVNYFFFTSTPAPPVLVKAAATLRPLQYAAHKKSKVAKKRAAKVAKARL
jgi:hypothetical protein